MERSIRLRGRASLIAAVEYHQSPLRRVDVGEQRRKN